MQPTNHGCYGTMFPSLLHAPTGKAATGKVFTVQISQIGCSHALHREIAVDPEAWNECVHCLDFDHCYKFSLAKLALENSVRTS